MTVVGGQLQYVNPSVCRKLLVSTSSASLRLSAAASKPSPDSPHWASSRLECGMGTGMEDARSSVCTSSDTNPQV